MGNIVNITENYVKKIMSQKGIDLLSAHDFKHVDRVRNWALRIASGEHYADTQSVELAALLHDIGLTSVIEENRNAHGTIGAEIARKYLKKYSLSEEKINEIARAIGYHNATPTTLARFIKMNGDKGNLVGIIRDADIMDSIGAIGLMRAFTSKATMQEYDPKNIKGITWGLSSKEFDTQFRRRLGIGEFIIDQINFQISYYDNLITKSGRRFAKPLIQYMKEFIIQLDNEITTDRKIP